MYSKSDNIEIMIDDDADKIMKNVFDSLKNRYWNNVELITGCGFVFDYAQLLYNKSHTINFNRSGSYKDSPDWIKN